MADTFNFPNGFEVKVFRKSDIIDCIEKNIIDKEVAMTIVTQCELDASNFLQEGRWTGIPFIGNIRIPEVSKRFRSEENKELLATAKETMPKEKYILFRRNLAVDAGKKEKQERLYRHIVSMTASRNSHLYRKLCKTKGEVYARIYMYCISDCDINPPV